MNRKILLILCLIILSGAAGWSIGNHDHAGYELRIVELQKELRAYQLFFTSRYGIVTTTNITGEYRDTDNTPTDNCSVFFYLGNYSGDYFYSTTNNTASRRP